MSYITWNLRLLQCGLKKSTWDGCKSNTNENKLKDGSIIVHIQYPSPENPYKAFKVALRT